MQIDDKIESFAIEDEVTKESNLTFTGMDIHGEYAKLRYFENLLTA